MYSIKLVGTEMPEQSVGVGVNVVVSGFVGNEKRVNGL